MKKFAALALALSLVAATSALAESVKPTDAGSRLAKSSGPIKMTDEQLDKVTAGQSDLIDIDVVVRNNEIVDEVQVAANIAAAVNVLGNQAASSVARFRQAQ